MLNLEDLYTIHEQNKDSIKAKVEEFSIGNKQFNFNTEKAILGVINLSNDSWYRESVCLSAETAIRRGMVLKSQGADVVDIGAESTLEKAERVEDIPLLLEHLLISLKNKKCWPRRSPTIT